MMDLTMKKILLALILSALSSLYGFAPNAHLIGRSVVSSLPKPSYGVQAEGTVVVPLNKS